MLIPVRVFSIECLCVQYMWRSWDYLTLGGSTDPIGPCPCCTVQIC